MSKEERTFLLNLIKDFRFDKYNKFDLEFDYEEFFSQTLDKILEKE